MKVVVFHGSSKRFTFVLVRKHVFNKSKSEYEIIQFEDFVKKLHILYLRFFTFVVLIYDVIW
jgi:hypothetical protein